MAQLSEMYYLRKELFKNSQVPTQSLIKKTMTKALANVYFKDMNPSVKILAGLEPHLCGGGYDWFVSPENLLKGEVSLKPVNNKCLSQLTYAGINNLGEQSIKDVHMRWKLDQQTALTENDKYWKQLITLKIDEASIFYSEIEKSELTRKTSDIILQVEAIYCSSFNKIENILFDAAIKSINDVRENIYVSMNLKYKAMLKQQASKLYDKYAKHLILEKRKLKETFIANIDNNRKETWNIAHDINIEKCRAIEKLRKLLESQNMACQVYVAIKEKEACRNKLNVINLKHVKLISKLTDNIALINYEISLLKDKEKSVNTLKNIWKAKTCHVVIKLQEFILYCLHLLPDYADIFINLEKLCLLQMNEAIVNPSCESIIKEDDDILMESPRNRTYVIYGDLKETVVLGETEGKLSNMPTFMINKHYLYASCNNFQQFSDKMFDFIKGRRGDEIEVNDDFEYSYSLPVKYRSSHKLLELELESSLMQVLQNEVINNVSTKNCACKVKYCFCTPLEFSNESIHKSCNSFLPVEENFKPTFSESKNINSREIELKHEREPKIYFANYAHWNGCKCPKSTQKCLQDHLPLYMFNTSKFTPSEIPYYETCTINELQTLVANMRKKPIANEQCIEKLGTKEASTQYYDEEFEALCTCFSDDDMEKLYQEIIEGSKMFNVTLKTMFDTVAPRISDTHLNKSYQSFASDRVVELRNIVEKSSSVKEIFMKCNCYV